MLWLALHLDALPLEALSAALPADLRAGAVAAVPRCVIDQRRVVCANAPAAEAGVQAGMSAATAAALVPGLQPLQRDAACEAAFIERLCLVASVFSPNVVPTPDGVLLELSSCLRLFGGAQTLVAALRQRLTDTGMAKAETAWATTAHAAALLARMGPRPPRGARTRPAADRERTAAADGSKAAAWQRALHARLDALPLVPVLAAWGAPARTLEFLQGVGCQRLGDVRALPRTGLQRRVGGDLLDTLAQTYGEAPDPRPVYTPPERFELGLELLERADDAGRLGVAAQRLVQPLASWLARQWLAVSRLTLRLRHETSRRRSVPDSRLQIGLADASRDAAQIGLLLTERLNRLELPAPVYALTLTADECISQAGQAAVLWRDTGPGAGAGWLGLVDRLGARLGPERVQSLSVQCDHRPELATRVIAAVDAPRPPPAARCAPLAPVAPPGLAAPVASLQTLPAFDPKPLLAQPPRPPWLLPQPLRLQEQAGRPLHGGPLRLRSRAERIEAGWFDGEPVSRDYHVAEGVDHRWRWIFRERRSDGAHWYLHGLFG